MASGLFSRELILLAGLKFQEVPRQGCKVVLQENGHIINAFEFRKKWKKSFSRNTPDDVDFIMAYNIQLHRHVLRCYLSLF